MAGKAFENLDGEGTALHDSWDNVARVVLLVVLLAVVTWAFVRAIAWAVHVALHQLFALLESGAWWAWPAVLCLLVVGGVVRGLLVRRPGWAEAAGDGMAVALDNYHVTYQHEGDDPQPRYERPAFGLALKKATMTVLTLGTGGSGGLEAPVVTVGEALGAGIARVMRARSEYELRTYQLAAIATAVATLLGAPFTAALFAIEIAYGDRVIYRKLAYCLLAALVAYILNNRLAGYQPLFVAPSHDPVYTLREYAMTALVAVAVSAPLAWAFGRVMTQVRTLAERVHPLGTGAGGALAAGLVAMALHLGLGISPVHVLGMGEETLAELLSGASGPVVDSVGLLLTALVGKMIATGLTIQSGGSAGILVPSMFMGGVSGAITARLLIATGWIELDVSLFVVVGIASALVAVIGVPMAAIALVLEVFGAAFGPPAILACGITYVVTLRLSVYRQQKRSPSPDADETGGL